MNEYLKSTLAAGLHPPLVQLTDRELLAWCYELRCSHPTSSKGSTGASSTTVHVCAIGAGESLAAYAANAPPNHQQMIEPALAALIERMTDQRVEVLQFENFATGRRDPDPIVNDNVMLTGFYQSQIGTYEAATGSTKFDEPGSLKFVWKDGRVFAYDHKSLSEAIVDNLERSNLGLYSCEPTWVFTICNTQAAQGLLGYDRIHGTNYWSKVSERFRKGLVGEMMMADGGFRHIRNQHVRLQFQRWRRERVNTSPVVS
jgi:hypothetical protein